MPARQLLAIRTMPGADPLRPLVDHPLDPDQARSLAIVFKALADPVRLRLLSLIASHPNGEACACELVPACNVSQPTVSHHLKALRDAGLLTSRRRSPRIQFRVVTEALACLADVLHSGTTWGVGDTA